MMISQVVTPDGANLVFCDWQGMTRIALPSDRVKTDANLDRPHAEFPIVLQSNGKLWSELSKELDPATLKKVPGSSSYYPPDPLGRGPIELEWNGSSVTFGEKPIALEPTGDVVGLGGRDGYERTSLGRGLDIFGDGSFAVFGTRDDTPQVAYLVRDGDGGASIGFCRRLSTVPHGRPRAYFDGGKVWVVDLDPLEQRAYLVGLDREGRVMTSASTQAAAGPWVFEGRVIWQPDETTIAIGNEGFEQEERFELPAEHAGGGEWLMAPGRKLYLPFHRVTILDLAPIKKGKSQISRKHKASDEPMYLESERAIRPLNRVLVKHGLCIEPKGVTRSGKIITVKFEVRGANSAFRAMVATTLRCGLGAVLVRSGVSAVDEGSTGLMDGWGKGPLLTVEMVDALQGATDEAKIPRAAGLGEVFTLFHAVASYKQTLPMTAEAEHRLLDYIFSGLRGESGDVPRPATVEDVEAAVGILDDYEAMTKLGLNGYELSRTAAVLVQRRFGETAAAPLRKLASSSKDELKKIFGAKLALREGS